LTKRTESKAQDNEVSDFQQQAIEVAKARRKVSLRVLADTDTQIVDAPHDPSRAALTDFAHF
jgi:hypothetical protein